MPLPLDPVICVPARNEEARLPALIEALGRQTWLDIHPGRRLPLVLVLNNGTDDSLAVALASAAERPHLDLRLHELDLPPEHAHVGTARRFAMDAAAELAPDGVILTTDADAVPDRNWVVANLRAVASGADAVGGLLIGDRREEAELPAGVMRRAGSHLRYARALDCLSSTIDPLPHDPWPRHSDHTGASLAIRARSYRGVGGLPVLPRREDLALVANLRAAGGLLRHAPDVTVSVSARLCGRASGGMADCLRDWMRAEAEGAPVLVEAPERAIERFQRRRLLRSLGGPVDFTALADRLGVAATALTDAGGRLRPPCQLIEALAPDEPDAPATVPVEEALSDVKGRIENGVQSRAA